MATFTYTLNELEEIKGIIEDIEYVDDNILLSIITESLNVIRVPKSSFKLISDQELQKGHPISIFKMNSEYHIILHSQGQEFRSPGVADGDASHGEKEAREGRYTDEPR